MIDISKSERTSPLDELEREIKDRSIDLTIDYTELSFDMLKTGVIEDIPLVKSLYTGLKLIGSVNAWFTTRNIMVFIDEYHNGLIDEEDRIKFLRKFESNHRYRQRVLELIIRLNERFLLTRKSKIMAQLFVAHINGELSWEKFTTLSQILDAINLSAIDLIQQHLDTPGKKHPAEGEEGLLMACGVGYRFGSFFGITNLGKELNTYGISRVLVKESD